MRGQAGTGTRHSPRFRFGRAKRLVNSFALAAMLCAGTALADTPTAPADDLAHLGSMDLEALLQAQFVTAASRYEQSPREAPSAISVITAEEIRLYGYQTLADVLRAQRGFYVTDDRNYSYAGVRGFGVPGDYNTRILFLLDGHRINDSVFNQAFFGNDALFDLDIVDRIEIIRGPSSSLYGTNAFFGVISIVTKRGSDIGGLQVSGAAGTRDTYDARATYGSALGEATDVLVSADFYTSDNDDHIFFPEYDDPATQDGVARDVDDEDAYRAGGHASYKDFTFSGAYVQRNKELPTGSFNSVFTDPRNETRDSRGYVDLYYEHDFANELSVNGRAYWDEWSYAGNYVYDPSNDPSNLVVNKDKADGQWWGAELALTKTLGSRNKLVVGGEYRDLYLLDQKNYDVDVYLDDERSAYDWALFVQHELKLIPDTLLLNAGVRYDYWSTSGGTTSPRVALIFQPTDMSTVKLLYGRAFRAPSAYELYFEDGGLSQKPSLDLDDETINTYELVFEHGFSRALNATISVFHYEIDNLIALELDPSDDILTFVNSSGVRSTGVEAEIGGSWRNLIDSRLSYTYQDAESAAGRLANSPHHVAKLNLGTSLFSGMLRVGFETQYVGERETIVGNTAADYAVANLTLSTDRLVENLELAAIARNLFDSEAFDPVSDAHLQEVIQQDGVRLLLKATYTFR